MGEHSAAAGSDDGADWSQRLLAFRQMGDRAVDAAIAQCLPPDPAPSDLRALVRHVVDDLARVKVDRDWCPAPLQSSGWQPPDLPAWAHDHALIERGQRVFNDRGLEMGAALVFAALPMAYAAVHGSEALWRTSDFATKHLTRRVAETGQMLIDVMGTRDPDCLEPGGRGYATAVGLRLLHGCVRALLQVESQRWPEEELGVPINQEIMLATLMDFTLVTWEAMERMGVDLPVEDRRAHLYTWSVIGNLMGLDACRERPLSLVDAEDMGAALLTQVGSTEGGRQLMAALLRELEGFMPLGLRKLPRSLVRWLFADAPDRVRSVPDLLDVPRAAWWSEYVFSAARAARRARLPAPLRGPVDHVTRRAGRLVFVGFADGFVTEAPPFRIPPELQRSWGVRTGPARTRVRAMRHRARTGIRAAPQWARTRTHEFTAVVRRGDGTPGP